VVAVHVAGDARVLHAALAALARLGAVDAALVPPSPAAVAATRAAAMRVLAARRSTAGLAPAGAIACEHVARGDRPVLLVSRFAEGAWQFLCGGDHEPGARPRRIEIGALIARDPTIAEVVELAPGCEAERVALGQPWAFADTPDDG
jgi:hypothetical protein